MTTPRDPNLDGPRPPALRAQLVRSSFYAATAAIVAWAAFVVPLPFIEQVPGTPQAIEPLVTIDGTETTELNGDTSLLTILLRQQATAPAIRAWLSPDRELLSVERVYPSGVDRDDYLAGERERFSRQFDIAAAVGAAAAGTEVELVTEAVIVDVLPGSPADGLLAAGDVVLAVGGEPIVAAEELQAITRAASPGDALVMEIRHQGELRTVVAELAPIPGEDGVRLGVQVETAVDEVRLPFEVSLAEGTRIGGPSAGMMVGLTVYDLLSDEDLLAGRHVMGTGTLDADGRVGNVGGVPQKIRAAIAAEADIVLVPERQLDQALEVAPASLTVVGVETLDDAIEALRTVDA
ncbi:MAG: PDZ domain-containing protein [Nitriliruptoraceae bacterium]|nr:PDZ domain-containing protein [Nitriliruptoraceae bacterium]